ncbi:LOW QUALITY PROTEIN: putrescine-ornithine antiporter [Psychrobacter sp. JCM 18900]|nr:LOW QUALITY PROTEIN: putrescine-ornithine antiporter [Psychrobacter sp. JCM 18900]
MFNPDPSAKPVNTKLPRDVIMMVEKNNLVMAIKTLAADENISMDEAKSRIDAYETQLKVKQQQKLNTIASKQGIPNQAISFDREQEEDEPGPLVKKSCNDTEQGFKGLQDGVDSQLNDLGYKKPLLPYWLKRLLVIAVLMIGMFWILWRVFG